MRAAADEDFRAKLALGREYEIRVASWLMRRGFLILPAYDYSGLGEDKPPRLEAEHAHASLVVPDLLVARAGRARWVEVKYKARADWTRVTQRRETGINLRLWRHYERTQIVTGLPVWLVFVHALEGEMRGASMDALRAQGPRVYEGPKMGRGGMVFFAYDSLRVLARYRARPVAVSDDA